MRPKKTDILTLKLYTDHDESLIRKMDKKMANVLPAVEEGHFWFISAKEQINESVIEYTLTKPCKTLDEWELEHKPAPKISSIDSDSILRRMEVDNNSSIYRNLMDHHNENKPINYEGFWWAVSKPTPMVNAKRSTFTLTDPIKDWATKVDVMTNSSSTRGIISKEPINPKRDIIYIAGAISGDVIANRHKFAAAKHNILASSANAAVLNPAELPDGLTQAQYMSICLPMVMTADTVYMLVGWEKSKGAVAEHALAEKLCINIEYQRKPGE